MISFHHFQLVLSRAPSMTFFASFAGGGLSPPLGRSRSICIFRRIAVDIYCPMRSSQTSESYLHLSFSFATPFPEGRFDGMRSHLLSFHHPAPVPPNVLAQKMALRLPVPPLRSIYHLSHFPLLQHQLLREPTIHLQLRLGLEC